MDLPLLRQMALSRPSNSHLDKLTAKVSALKEAAVRLFEINERTAGIRVSGLFDSYSAEELPSTKIFGLFRLSPGFISRDIASSWVSGKARRNSATPPRCFNSPLQILIRGHLRGGRQKRAFDVENISPAVLM